MTLIATSSSSPAKQLSPLLLLVGLMFAQTVCANQTISDVSLQLVTSDQSVVAGTSTTYFVHLRNFGPHLATGIKVGVVAEGALIKRLGDCRVESKSLAICDLSQTLFNQQSAFLELELAVAADSKAIRIDAEVLADGEDLDSANNVSTQFDTPRTQVDLITSASCDYADKSAASGVSCELTVANLGPSTAVMPTLALIPRGWHVKSWTCAKAEYLSCPPMAAFPQLPSLLPPGSVLSLTLNGIYTDEFARLDFGVLLGAVNVDVDTKSNFGSAKAPDSLLLDHGFE